MSSWQELVDRWAKDGPVTANGAGLRYQSPEGVQVDVSAKPEGDDRVTLSATWTAPAWLASASSELLPGLGDLARAVSQGAALLTSRDTGTGVEISMPLYLEELSRQSFIGAVAEVAHAYSGLQSLAAELESRRGELVDTDKAIAEVKAAVAATDLATAEPSVPASKSSAGWVPTHRAPGEGLDARARPEPTDKVVARLDPWLEVRVSERSGDWAHIVCSNEWSAWVDGRKLVAK